MKNKIKLLHNLVKIPSPSGFEEKVAHFIRKYLSQFISSKRITIDFHNNIIVKIKGKSSEKKIQIDAHQDIIGFLVNNVDKEGYISLLPLGGHDKSLLRGRHIIILSERKTIEGVLGTKPIHLIEDEEEELPSRIVDLTADIGVRKRKQVKKYIKIGDPAVLKPSFSLLLEDFVSGYGFDDKSGCLILMETIKEIAKSKNKPLYDLYFTFSSQEEVGCKGAKELVRKINPDLFIGVDVTFATDCYEVEEREVGRCELGKGIVVFRGLNIDKKGVKLLSSIARFHKIKVQYQATNGTGFNADEVANDNKGIKVLNLGIPLRNMHSAVEVLNLKDLSYGIKLLKHFLLSRKVKGIL